jgi:hypothetical protein
VLVKVVVLTKLGAGSDCQVDTHELAELIRMVIVQNQRSLFMREAASIKSVRNLESWIEVVKLRTKVIQVLSKYGVRDIDEMRFLDLK